MIKHPSTFVLTVGVLLAAQGATAQRADDERSIHGVIQAHAAAWNRRDPKAAAAVYASDAVVRTSSGRLIVGRAAIEQAHREWLAQDTVGGGSIHLHPTETIKIQFRGNDVAVADVDGCFAGPPGADGRRPPPSCVPLFIVVTRVGGHWEVAEQRALAQPQR